MKLTSFLVDPFQKRVHQIEIENNINDWHKVLDCDILDHVLLGEYAGLPIDGWVDDEGLLREPNYPYWIWVGYRNQLCGYGLINSSNNQGKSISSNLSLSYCLAHCQYEEWERRLDPEKYLDQMTRIYAFRWEGRFGIGSTEIHL